MCKNLISAIFVLFVCCTFPLKVYADSERIEIDSYNLDENSYYIDLLINLSENDEAYTSFNSANMDSYEFNVKSLSEYSDNEGFVSFSCHYKDVFTDMTINPVSTDRRLISRNCFTLRKLDDGSLVQDLNLMGVLLKHDYVFKILVLDKNGEIIKKSPEMFNASDILYEIKYDLGNNTFYAEKTDDKITVYEPKLLLFIVGLLIFLFALLFIIRHNRIKKQAVI